MEDNGRYIYSLPYGSDRVSMKHQDKLKDVLEFVKMHAQSLMVCKAFQSIICKICRWIRSRF